jgi:hypothetical protein
MQNWLLILILGQMTLMLGAFWILAHYLTQQKRLRLEERSRILDRFTSGPELAAFLATPEGSKLLASINGSARPKERALAQSYGIAAILLCLGFGFLALQWLGVLGGRAPLVPGVLSIAAGIGVWFSGVIARRLTRGEAEAAARAEAP